MGKNANMVILSGNPYEVNKKEIKNLKVEQLYLMGEKYRSCERSVIGTVFSGLLSKEKHSC